MKQEEWRKRYWQRFRDKVKFTEDGAPVDDATISEIADATSFADASDGYEDDPEGAADEEMSYWEP